MQRRDFMVNSAAVGAGALAAAATIGASSAVAQDGAAAGKKFKLNLAPHFDMFAASAGPDLVDQLKFGHDQGFTAWEDNWLPRRPVEEQERIGKALADLGMTMGIFVCHADMGRVTFAGRDEDARNKVVEDIKASVDVAKRVNAKWMTLVCDSYDPRLEWPYQMANCIDLLRRCADVFEPHDLVMVAEPLNWRRDHPGLLLHTPAQCYEVCRGANSPAVKVLFDLYHTQIQCGNLIPNLDQCWDEVAYIQTGDHPGRNEPGTGEINYRNVFKHIHDKGYKGVVGLEHGMSKQGKEGEAALIAAYRAADDF
jgi:hydroxypyruvate isomerase